VLHLSYFINKLSSCVAASNSSRWLVAPRVYYIGAGVWGEEQIRKDLLEKFTPRKKILKFKRRRRSYYRKSVVWTILSYSNCNRT